MVQWPRLEVNSVGVYIWGLVRERQKEREKPKKQREGTWNILVTESEDSVVPWNVNGTLGGEVTTNSERVMPLTFVSFSQCVVGDILQLLLFKVGGWATAGTAGIPETASIAITIATQGILLTKSENSVVPWNVNGTWKGDVQYNDIEHFVLCEYFLAKEFKVEYLLTKWDSYAQSWTNYVYVFTRA